MKWLQTIQHLDIRTFNWCMARPRREQLTALSRAVSRTADGWMYLLFFTCHALVQPSSGLALATLAFWAFAVERAVYWVLKNTCRRNRPQQALAEFTSFIIPSDTFSFPSGHTSGAFLFTFLVASQLPVLLPFLLIWSIGVAGSRIFLGVHFPTDTLVGAGLGSLVGYGMLGLFTTQGWL
ncbi:phosphatase PAP2 family protein [Saccharospirillum impatiens]|uniref:phosphatase PAP2 family protein n=1 Tax=Saccharospirillum impatiens TaxID=169438 RepID=UPI0004256F16|nr:phosphatase PAP2 family protein [Saccharospirillum impatiens]